MAPAYSNTPALRDEPNTLLFLKKVLDEIEPEVSEVTHSYIPMEKETTQK